MERHWEQLAGDVARAVGVIRAGGVLLSPTDTVYGLACDPFSHEAVRKVLELKGREEEKGFLLLIGDPTQAALLAALPPRFEELARRLWPGPVTLLLPALPEVPVSIAGQQGKIGLRIPRDPFWERVLGEWGKPVLSTSANRSGQPAPQTLAELRALFAEEVDLFLAGGEPVAKPPSTVVDLTARPGRIVRAGSRVETVERRLRMWEEGAPE